MFRADRGRGGAHWALPVRRWGPVVFAVVLAGAAIWRARYGIDFSDSSHAVELALRMAQGDAPFRDELNIQVLGSWPAVPFVWVWTHVAGIDGLVLASRVFYVLLGLACGVASWRAVAPHVGRGTAAAAIGVALIPAAYNQQVVSYNTTPSMAYLLAVCAGAAAIGRRSLPWGVVSGAAVVLGAMSHPVTAPAAVALVVVLLLLARGRGLLGVGAGLAGTGIVVAVLALGVWGLANLRETLAFTDDYQSTRAPREVRIDRWLTFLGGEMSQPWAVAAFVLSGLAVLVWAVPALRRARGVLVVAAVAAAGVQAVLRGSSGSTFSVASWLSPVLATVLLVVLLPTALASAVARRGMTARVVALGLLPTLVGMPFVAGFTSSAPIWGATGAVIAPGLFAVTVATLAWVSEHGRVVKAAVALLLVAGLAFVHTANSFRDGSPGHLTATVADGAYAGLRTTPERRETIADNQLALSLCARPGDGVLAYIYPAAFLLGDVRFATPITWLDFFGESNTHVLAWYGRTGRVPQCVVAARAFWPGYGRTSYVREPDPLRSWVQSNYRVVTQTPEIVVLERRT
ncbi:hypothetical protein [Intrasporangium flavum]|uniref:hypothetical protein n=1 Tax=Intrasporangium flavum TaxID=1428657 RepID=UPI001A97A273|nr:hypothetical protein [Intrasporangium flavum]